MQISEKILQGHWWDLQNSEVMKMSLYKSDKSLPVYKHTTSICGTTFINLH